MNFIPLKVLNKALIKTATENSSTIIAGAAVAGVVTTAVMSFRAGYKVCELVEKENSARFVYAEQHGAYYEPMTRKEIFKASARYYIIPVLSAGMTIGFIIAANRIDANKKTALASAYALSEQALSKYQNKVTELLGEDADKKVKDAIFNDQIRDNPPTENNQVVVVADGVTFMDSHTGRYFKSSISKVEHAGNVIDRQLNYENEATYNDLAYELGLPNITSGDEKGWDIQDGMLDFDINSTGKAPDGTPCIIVKYRRPTNLSCPF